MSHVIVLPQDPSAAPPPGMTPSAIPDQSQDDALGDIFGGGMATDGNMGECAAAPSRACSDWFCCSHVWVRCGVMCPCLGQVWGNVPMSGSGVG